MTVKQNHVEPPKVKMVVTLPSGAGVENGELYYDITNGKLALKTEEGWKQWTED